MRKNRINLNLMYDHDPKVNCVTRKQNPWPTIFVQYLYLCYLQRDLPSRFISDIFHLSLRTYILNPHSLPVHPIISFYLQAR